MYPQWHHFVLADAYCPHGGFFGQVPLYFSQFLQISCFWLQLRIIFIITLNSHKILTSNRTAIYSAYYVQGNLHSEMRSIRPSTVTNLFQSWVPGVTSLRMYSAPTMAAAYDRAVWLIVVITSEPPGCVYHGRRVTKYKNQ